MPIIWLAHHPSPPDRPSTVHATARPRGPTRSSISAAPDVRVSAPSVTEMDWACAESCAKLRNTGGSAIHRPARSPAHSPPTRRARLHTDQAHRSATATADIRRTKPETPARLKPIAPTYESIAPRYGWPQENTWGLPWRMARPT